MLNRLRCAIGIAFVLATLLHAHATMPSPVFPYDPEWADSLVGLPLAVPKHWWPGFNSPTLCLGKIISINKNANSLNCFVLQVHDEPGQRYGMRYDAVFLYADENHPNASSYHLPSDPPGDPAQERSVRVRRRRPPPGPPLPVPARRHALLRQAPDEPDSDEGDSDEDSDDEYLVTYTDPDDWILVTEDNIDSIELPVIEKIPYEPRQGEGEDFDVKISVNELASLKDMNGDIRYEKVVDHLLPRFEGEGYYEWIAARVRSYMLHIIRKLGWKPKYYKPSNDKVVLGTHIARFFGVQITRMLRGFPSIDDVWSTRESLFEIGVATESMPRDAFTDINRCLHFIDAWDEGDGEEWDDIYIDEKYEAPPTAKHRTKFAIVEDAHNVRWKVVIKHGADSTYDETRCSGAYPGPIVIGPEPKPIRTGATIHSMCVTKGPLKSYMLHIRVYGGKTDSDIKKINPHVGSQQVFINLLEVFLEYYMGRGCTCTMDSAYMGELLAQVATKAWKMNVVGTTTSNRCGPDFALVKSERAKMKAGT